MASTSRLSLGAWVNSTASPVDGPIAGSRRLTETPRLASLLKRTLSQARESPNNPLTTTLTGVHHQKMAFV